MKPIEYLQNCVMSRLQPSPIHGVGVFAIRDIKKGEEVFGLWKGRTGRYELTDEEYNTLSIELKEYIFDMFGVQKHIRLYNNCHFVFITPQFFINTLYEKGNVDCFTFRALCDINKGEELFSNYGYNHIKNII